MPVLIAGIVIFLGAHSFTMFRDTRAQLIGRIGTIPYRVGHSLVSLAGFGPDRLGLLAVPVGTA